MQLFVPGRAGPTPTRGITRAWWLLLLLWPSLVSNVVGQTATVNFTITLPNSTWPSLGELWEGSLTYSTTPGPVAFLGYPVGFPLISATGTRTVWTATADAPTDYLFNSTAIILDIVPSYNPQYWFNNVSIPFGPGINRVQLSPGGLAADSAYGSIAVELILDLANYTLPDGFQEFPITELVYNNLFYPPAQVADSMDSAGWLFWLDRPQVGALNVSLTSMFAGDSFLQYQSVVNIYAGGGSPQSTGDLSDDSANLDPNTTPITFGFNGLINIVQPAASSVKGDPQFVGLRGQSYQVHGMDRAVYNLIVDEQVVVNARFRSLSGGRCPVNEAPTNCWSHAGSYMGDIGIRTVGGDTLVVSSGGYDEGFSSITLNGERLSAGMNLTGASNDKASLQVAVMSAYSMQVRCGNFELQLDNSDLFINLASLRVLEWHKLASHGLLGQTWRQSAQPGKQFRYIEGDIDDYVEQSNDLLGTALIFGPKWE